MEIILQPTSFFHSGSHITPGQASIQIIRLPERHKFFGKLVFDATHKLFLYNSILISTLKFVKLIVSKLDIYCSNLLLITEFHS